VRLQRAVVADLGHGEPAMVRHRPMAYVDDLKRSDVWRSPEAGGWTFQARRASRNHPSTVLFWLNLVSAIDVATFVLL
jgi:hypothetical protein